MRKLPPIVYKSGIELEAAQDNALNVLAKYGIKPKGNFDMFLVADFERLTGISIDPKLDTRCFTILRRHGVFCEILIRLDRENLYRIEFIENQEDEPGFILAIN